MLEKKLVKLPRSSLWGF